MKPCSIFSGHPLGLSLISDSAGLRLFSVMHLYRYQKKDDLQPLDLVTNPKARERVLAAVRAVEAHMALYCVAMGILQMISLRVKGTISLSEIWYTRTPSKATVSEATVMYYLRKYIFRIIVENPE